MSKAESFKSLGALIKHVTTPDERTAAIKYHKSALQIHQDVFEQSMKTQQEQRSNPMTRLEVKSNSARSKTMVFGPRGELVLHFDRNGVATFASHLLPILEEVMAVKPGRFEVLTDAPSSSEAAPAAVDADMAAEVSHLLKVLKDQKQEDADEEEEADSEDESDEDADEETQEEDEDE